MKYLLAIIALFFFSSSAHGQAVAEIRTELITNDAGNVVLSIIPQEWDMTVPKPSKSYKVYAALICYTYKGEQKAMHQDLTKDFEKEGSSEEFLAFGATKNNVIIGDVTFYRRDELPADHRPKKADCFK